ncbi:hypothetical protein Pmar_PMAR007322 [Perkinsus marinus ATCC 50983]|uniref:Uncharacterized protein n=1 Tax=Perkinsus marinus (strain ATCC 50983 / TXsc) TaxID=423536 RepID=C5K631_PERM5|nr:hypothetical protein Pmar_PMAR007322 [Perkinsus marinus ATCC 50983]EER20061.1 hypothetical protein Pmar_PMAR007322 [Perkinsus marinus ATCC 50983]|eukprot:XP_002788265.1 hypothetical protein Pmar_PMAR007322 [Perkinsus marinus ATCC 50983]
MDNIVTAAQNSATDFGFSRMVYSYARQLRMERKKYPDQHTDVGGMRQVVLDIVRSEEEEGQRWVTTSGGGLGEKKRRKKGGGDNSQADADENSKVTQSRSKPRCFTMMDEACENVTPTSPIKSLLELHALLKLIEPRMHEFRGLSVSFWRALNHLLRCCQDRERWGRDRDTVEEIQMYWVGVVEQFEGRVVRRGGCRHDKVPNIDSFYDKIGASDELAESDGEGLGRENVDKVMVYAYHVKGMQGRPRNRQFRPPWLRPPLGLKQLPMDESMPICQSSQHHHLEQFSTREWSFIDDILDLNTDAAEAIVRLSVLGGEHFRTLNDRTGFCHD